MAERKKLIIVTSNDTTDKISPVVDTLLMQMLKLTSDNMILGKLKIKVVMEGNVMVINVFEVTGLSEEYKALGTKIQESVYATLKGVSDGEIKVKYEVADR